MTLLAHLKSSTQEKREKNTLDSQIQTPRETLTPPSGGRREMLYEAFSIESKQY